MPANWGGFTAQMNSWFCGNAEGGEDYQQAGAPTAKKIADEYQLAITGLAAVLPYNNLLTGGWVKATMESGFKASFSQAFNLAGIPPEGVDLGVPTWIPAATGTVNAWAAATFNPLPPHPPDIAPTTGVQLLDPGLGAIPSLAKSIHDAFHSQQCASIAGILVSGFTQHLSMISGIYLGLIPTPTGPVPGPPIPWVGVA